MSLSLVLIILEYDKHDTANNPPLHSNHSLRHCNLTLKYAATANGNVAASPATTVAVKVTDGVDGFYSGASQARPAAPDHDPWHPLPVVLHS